MEILIIFLINVLLFFTDLKSSKKMNNVENVSFKEFKKKISLYGSLAELHFKLMKILCFITYDQSSYYCFCDKYDSAELTQLAHDVVATLGFGCILVATSDNVVTMLSQHCVSDVITTTKN